MGTADDEMNAMIQCINAMAQAGAMVVQASNSSGYVLIQVPILFFRVGGQKPHFNCISTQLLKSNMISNSSFRPSFLRALEKVPTFSFARFNTCARSDPACARVGIVFGNQSPQDEEINLTFVVHTQRGNSQREET